VVLPRRKMATVPGHPLNPATAPSSTLSPVAAAVPASKAPLARQDLLVMMVPMARMASLVKQEIRATMARLLPRLERSQSLASFALPVHLAHADRWEPKDHLDQREATERAPPTGKRANQDKQDQPAHLDVPDVPDRQVPLVHREVSSKAMDHKEKQDHQVQLERLVPKVHPVKMVATRAASQVQRAIPVRLDQTVKKVRLAHLAPLVRPVLKVDAIIVLSLDCLLDIRKAVLSLYY